MFCCWLSERHFGCLTVIFAPNAIVAQNMANLQNTVFHGFPLVYLCVLCKQHFGVFTEKFVLNQITTHKMASLENIVSRLKIIILCHSCSAYHQNDTLKYLPWNCHLTPLRPKRKQISKIPSHAVKSSLSSSYLVLFIIGTFWSFYGEILAEPYYCPKDRQIANTVRRLIVILLRLFFFLINRATIWSPRGKNLPDPR